MLWFSMSLSPAFASCKENSHGFFRIMSTMCNKIPPTTPKKGRSDPAHDRVGPALNEGLFPKNATFHPTSSLSPKPSKSRKSHENPTGNRRKTASAEALLLLESSPSSLEFVFAVFPANTTRNGRNPIPIPAWDMGKEQHPSQSQPGRWRWNRTHPSRENSQAVVQEASLMISGWDGACITFQEHPTG